MRQFIVLLLMLSLTNVGFAQDVPTKTQKTAPKTSTKKKVSRTKAKTKAKPTVTTLEAATKDGKPVTLKSNGTWEYTKLQTPTPTPKATVSPSPTATPAPTPSTTPTPAPTATPVASVKPNPVIKTSPTPVVNASPVPKSTPNAKTSAFLLSKTCDLGLNDSPTIRGLKLGMPRAEADRLIPPDRVRYLESTTITAYPQFGKAAGFENIYQISAQFSEEKLSGLEIIYDPTAAKWKNAKEFADILSENFNIPRRFWKFNAKTPAFSEIRCREFLISIDSLENEIRLEKQAAVQTTVQAKDDGKKVFKP
jgi:hypothetical protein